MINFLSQQIDFFHFIQSFSFLILTIVAFIAAKEKSEKDFGWNWLARFTFCQALYHLFHLLFLVFESLPLWNFLSMLFLYSSYAYLLIFISFELQKKTNKLQQNSLWIALSFFLLGIIIYLLSAAQLSFIIRSFLAIILGAFSVWALYHKAYQEKHPGNLYLKHTGLLVLLFISLDAFDDPVSNFIKAAAILTIAFITWHYLLYIFHKNEKLPAKKNLLPGDSIPILIMLLLIGFIATNLLSSRITKNLTDDNLTELEEIRARITAADMGIKQTLANNLLEYQPLSFVLDPHGIILQANPSDLANRPLWPIDPITQSSIKNSKEFSSLNLNPVLTKTPKNGQEIHYKNSNHLYLSLPITNNWSLAILISTDIVSIARLLGILITFFFTALLLLIYFSVAQNELNAITIFNEKERFSTIIYSIGDGVLAVDLEKRITFINRSAEELTGWSEKEALGKPLEEVFNIIDETTRTTRKNPVEAAFLTGKITYLANHTVLICKNGEEKIIADSAAPIHDRNKNLVGAVLTFRDISERAKLEAELNSKIKELSEIQKAMLNINDDLFENEQKIKIANEEWEKTFNAISDLVFIQDTNYRIIRGNKAFFETMKTTQDQIIGKKCYEVMHHRSSPWPNCPFHATLADKKSHVEEVSDPVIGADLLVTTSPILDNSGKLFGSVHIAKDITEIKRREREIQAKNAELERLYKVKSEFTSMVSHELRTPLTAIKEGIHIVLDGTTGPINEQQTEFLTIAKRNVDRLHNLVNEVLDLSRLESGKMVFNFNPGNLAETILEAVNSQKPIADKKGLKLEITIEKNLPTVVFDSERIIEVVNNLLNNAFKFTDQGGVTVFVQNDHFNHGIKVCIADTGIGITKENLEKLFTPYQQIGEVNRKTGGTGLGLSISKQIIEKHKGTMWIESEPNKGSKFWFTIPGKQA